MLTCLAAFFIFAVPPQARADNLFRLFPERQENGFYGDNIPLQTHNGTGDFGTAMVVGFYPRLHLGGQIRVAALRYFRPVIRASDPVRSRRAKDSLSI